MNHSYRYIIVIALCLGSWVSMAQSASEQFDYVEGTAIDGQGTATNGWSGPWEILAGTDKNVALGGILNNANTGETSGNSLDVDYIGKGDNVRLLRRLSDAYPDDGSTYWLGFWYKGVERNVLSNVFNVVLVDADAAQGTGPNGQLARFGTVFGNSKIAIDAGGVALTDADADTAHWIVAKIETNGTSDPDLISLYLNADPATEPTVPDATFATNNLNNGFSGVMVRIEGDEGVRVLVDDLFLGTSFGDIVPPDLTFVTPGIEQFDYADGTTIEGAGLAEDGWTGPWKRLTGTDKNIVAGGIANAINATQTGSNKLDVDFSTAGNNVRLWRGLSSSFPDNGNVYWVSFMYNGVQRDVNGNVFNVILADTTSVGASGPGGQLARLGTIFGNPNIGIDAGGVAATSGAADTTHWVVAKVITNGTSDGDTIRMFLNPNPGLEPLDSQADAQFVTNNLNNGFNGIMVRIEGTEGVRVLLDDIVVGKSFNEAVPDDLQFIEPASEDFNYTVGTTLDNTGAATNGWGGPWEVIAGMDQEIISGGITNNNIFYQTSGNKLDLDFTEAGNNIRVVRKLASGYPDNGSTYWLGFWYEGLERTAGGNVFNVILGDTAAFAGSGGGGQLVRFGTIFNNGFLGIDLGGPLFPGTAPTDEAHWVVAKVETNGTAEADTIRMFVNPDPMVQPADSLADVKVATTRLNNGFNGIMVKQEGTAGVQTILDDLYVGIAYNDVVPRDLIQLDNAPLPAFDKFDYAVDDSIKTDMMIGAEENGWSGPWKSLTGSAVVQADSVDNYFILKSTTSNALRLDNSDGTNSTRIYRGLSSLYEDVGRTYWLGFWTDASLTATGDVFQVILADTAVLAPSGGAGQLARIGINFNNNNIQVVAGGTADTGISGDTTRWVVAKIEMSANADADSIRLFIDPTPGVEPDDEDAVAVLGTTVLNNGWNGIMVKNEAGSTDLSGLLDNLYIGNSFEEIQPDDLQDLIALDVPFVVHEPFDYPVGEPLQGQGVSSITEAWSTAWMKSQGDDALTQSESLDNQLTTIEGGSTLLTISEGEQDTTWYDRRFRATFQDDGSNVWLSFLMNSDDFQVSKSSRLSFLNGMDEVVSFGGIEGLSVVGITSGDALATSSSEVRGTNWIVARIEMSGNEDPETIRLWVNPDPTLPPLDITADITIEDDGDQAVTLNDGFDGLRLAIRGFTPFEAGFDEIRVGFNFGDVSKLQEEVDPNLIVQDRFTYSAGEPLEGQGFAAAGWAGPWVSVGAENNANVVSGNIASPVDVAVKGNQAELASAGGTVRYFRPLETPITDDGGEYWISTLINFGPTAANGNVGQLFLYNSSFPAPQDQRLALGKNFDDTGQVGLFDRASGAVVNSGIDARNNFWLVMKVQMSGDDQPDIAWLWIDPDPTVTPEESAAATSVASTSLNAGFDGLFVKSEGGPALTTSFDEIRLGTTYESVSPSGEGGSGGPDPVTSVDDLTSLENSLRNYPNPFSGQTTIVYTLEKTSTVELSILNLQGQEIMKLDSGTKGAGTHEVTWDRSNANGKRMPTGIYLYRIIQDDISVTKRLVIIDR
ncbi:MAG: T9SS type A sorting domain-containing protein [Bacteroidota bacterium]